MILTHRLLAQVWDIVFDAQTQSSRQFLENSTAASVDIAARQMIAKEGYGEAFTHRVGHGIGIKGMSWKRKIESSDC